MRAPHTPVLLDEVIEALAVRESGVYVDCTFGAGGYSRGILNKADCKVIGIDQDPTTQKYVEACTQEFSNRFLFRSGNFSNLKELVKDQAPVDGVVLDLGVSSMQLDEGDRGFSFQQNAKLDMRMSSQGISAYELINQSSEAELADIIYLFGEEHAARRIAKKIVEARKETPIETTLQLANLVRSVVRKQGKIDPSTKTFQAIRIAVNDELNALKEALNQSIEVLAPKGRLVVVSFHALEDRIVKEFINNHCMAKVAKSKYHISFESTDKPFKYVHKKSIKPSKDEVATNPRSRSARLRVVEKNENYHA